MERDITKLQSYPSPLRFVDVNGSGNSVYRGYGIVFGGRDLYGDTFSRPREYLAGDDKDAKLGTEYFLSEIADEIDYETGEIKGAMEVPVFWDHGLGSLGTRRLGRAVPIKVTQEGIEYLIEIEKQRAKEYQELIDAVYYEKMLGASSQTLPSFASFDYSSWEIKSWFPAEMTLTVTPAEHRTRDQVEKVRSLFKQYGVEIDMTRKTTEEEIQGDELHAEDESAMDAVDDLLNDLDTAIEEEETAVLENEALSYVVNAFDELTRSIEAISQRLDTMDEQLARAATDEQVAELNQQFVSSLKTLGEGLSTVLTKAVRSRAAQVVQNSSDYEISALRTLGHEEPAPTATPSRSMYSLPIGAPGQ